MRKHYEISVIIGVNVARGADRIGSAPFGLVIDSVIGITVTTIVSNM